MTKHNDIVVGKNLKMTGCKILIKGKNNSLKIGNDTILRKVFIEIIGENCSIEIGNNCMIGYDSYLSAREVGIVLKIGSNTGLSRNVKVMTSDGHPIYKNDLRCNEAKDITIGQHVWIADNVTILKGVTIGNDSVIGINATVTKSVPIASVAAGNPAKIVHNNISWDV